MADRMAAAVGRMCEQFVEFSGVECTYTRGGRSESITLRRSPQATQVVDLDGVAIEWQPVDFLGATADMPFGRPIRGDQIRCAIQGATVTHEVFSPGAEKPYRDMANAMTRIHTKVVN